MTRTRTLRRAPDDGRVRVVITGVSPQIDGGRYPIKRTLGETIAITADIFADGHDELGGALLYRHERQRAWQATPLRPLGNDRWEAAFSLTRLGRYYYTLQAWIDRYRTWARDLAKRVAAGQDVSGDLLIGAELVAAAARGASGRHRAGLRQLADRLRGADGQRRGQAGHRRGAAGDLTDQRHGVANRLRGAAGDIADRVRLALDPAVADRMQRHGERAHRTTYERELAVVVDRERARFSAWYELFPRSAAPEPGRHGTLRDCAARVPYVAAMGFDVLYLPPIHPIGRTCRKGRNNAGTCTPADPGSPWAVGAREGGHTDIHPELGTLDDFQHLVATARQHGMEVALDLAFQCSPDHPYVSQHPEWFRRRPDGSIQHAENPPKQYQDIYPLDFESAAWRALWQELLAVVRCWIDRGVRIFRVDNPHTKPFAFWEWLIGRIKQEHPDVIFLSEAFTRPKVMYQLAKLGFTQSYTYFAWRNTRRELTDYCTELTRTEVREYFRPHFWPNTPDILTETLQFGGRPAFMSRLVLAATLAAGYGIYGPAFELCEHRAAAPGTEEYLDSEKYTIRHWDLERPDSLRDFIARVNGIRRQNPALQWDHNLHFHPVDNDQLIAYSKHTDDRANIILVVVNLDPHHTQSGWVEVAMSVLGLDPEQPYQVHDLLTDARYLWRGARNFVQLDPHVVPAHLFRIRRRVLSERDFDYFA